MALPSLWGMGLPQDALQAEAWYWGTAVLLCAGRACAPRRTFPSSRALAVTVGTVVLVGACHVSRMQFPILVLNMFVAWIGVQQLVAHAPSAAWIERRIVCLALMNVGVKLVQHTGWDPFFTNYHYAPGLYGRINHLVVLWLAALPLACGWQQVVLACAVLKSHSLFAIGLLMGWVAWVWSPRPAWTLSVGSLGMAGWWLTHPLLWRMKAASRLFIWRTAVTHVLRSPWRLLTGFGMGAWNQMRDVRASDPNILYSGYVTSLHVGGVVLVVGVLWVLWEIVHSQKSPARLSLLAIAAMGLTQDVFSFPRLLMLMSACYAAWMIRRADAH